MATSSARLSFQIFENVTGSAAKFQRGFGSDRLNVRNAANAVSAKDSFEGCCAQFVGVEMELVNASVFPGGLSGFADSRWIANETVSQISTASASEKSFNQKSLKIKSRIAGSFRGNFP